ncbi:MAG: amidohydrolase family protein [Treponema sp.]|nr:amidohydrolase family protein [Treponema sp.]
MYIRNKTRFFIIVSLGAAVLVVLALILIIGVSAPKQPRGITILPPPALDTTIYDTVILNARLINPETGSDLNNYNIGILNGRIAALTRRPLQGTRSVDAEGLVAVPGFIDVISFELIDSSARYKISDGVTTNLVMHGGTNDAKKWYDNIASRPYFVNYGASSFITVMRREVGYGDRTVMTDPDAIETLVKNVRRNIMDGALGISISPEYVPGVGGAEMLALSKLAAEMDVASYYHLRYATPDGEKNSLVAIQEVLDLARETGASTHIMHIPSTGATHVAPQAFAMVSDAIAEGLDITACMYPYDYWASWLPSERFNSGWQQRFRLTYNDLQVPGTTERLTAETFRRYRSQWMIVLARNSIPEDEVRLAIQQPFISISSDDVIMNGGRSHPRGAGTFSRVIGKYAREEGVISLMDAVAMMTIRSARRLESASDDIKRKGRLEIGADADIVLFCYDTIIDTGTPENPDSYSDGIRYVWVNGRMGLNPNGILGVRAGRPIKSRFASPAEPAKYTEYTLTFNKQAVAIPAFDLFNLHFVDLQAAAGLLQQPFELAENGNITFGQARLSLGETAFTSYGQESHFHHEPVIFRGSVYLPVCDLPNLLHGLSYM